MRLFLCHRYSRIFDTVIYQLTSPLPPSLLFSSLSLSSLTSTKTMLAAYLVSAKFFSNRQPVYVYSNLMHPQAIWEAYAQSEGQNSRSYPFKVSSDQQYEANAWAHTMCNT